MLRSACWPLRSAESMFGHDRQMERDTSIVDIDAKAYVVGQISCSLFRPVSVIYSMLDTTSWTISVRLPPMRLHDTGYVCNDRIIPLALQWFLADIPAGALGLTGREAAPLAETLVLWARRAGVNKEWK
jgi:hypothetical protein